MGGEGSMMAANQSLKSNRSLLKKRKEKGALRGSYSNMELKEFPKATPEILKEIRERIQKERKQTLIKSLILFAVITSILTLIVIL